MHGVALSVFISQNLLSYLTIFKLVETEGEMIEKGIVRRLPDGFDGNTCPYIFTWSHERPNKVSCTCGHLDAFIPSLSSMR
jgi:hypothetical protein